MRYYYGPNQLVHVELSTTFNGVGPMEGIVIFMTQIFLFWEA